MRRTTGLLLAALLLLTGAACSDDDGDDGGGGEGATTTAAATDGTDAPDDTAGPDATDDDGGEDGDGGGPVEEMTTSGLRDYLSESYPDDDFAGEVSLLSETPDIVRLGTQTSFFEADEAVAYCEAVAEYVYEVAGGDPARGLELVATSGAELATRASADAACEPGADV